ncbi:hypothetical protein HXX02_00120 [Microbulbifer elongatus]|uniref:Lipoprotein n=1 Tax=Microbulbifer elongatus TaxID=86173 RepID=A0ABT1NVG8_9GAMM|nr:hypothetical protein [Microbulbifer elongatus]MCQ3827840.1 hypothetical protein [Microbulbifer elongatus]
MKRLILVALVGLSGCTSVDGNTNFAYEVEKKPSEYDSHAEYLANPKVQSKYQKDLETGKIESLKSEYIESCSDEIDGIVGFCECVSDEISGTSSEEIFYSQKLLEEYTSEAISAFSKGDEELRLKIIDRIQKETVTGQVGSLCRDKLKG